MHAYVQLMLYADMHLSCFWHASHPSLPVPLRMPTPAVLPISHSQLNVTWAEPNIKDIRGKLLTYRLYVYMKMDLQINPNAPPYKWQVITTNNIA